MIHTLISRKNLLPYMSPCVSRIVLFIQCFGWFSLQNYLQTDNFPYTGKYMKIVARARDMCYARVCRCFNNKFFLFIYIYVRRGIGALKNKDNLPLQALTNLTSDGIFSFNINGR